MKNILSGLGMAFKPVMDFSKEYPLAFSILAGATVSAAANAFSPDAVDVERERDRLKNNREDQERLRREKNLNVGGISLTSKPSESRTFMENSGTSVDPNSIIQGKGLIGRRMGGGQ